MNKLTNLYNYTIVYSIPVPTKGQRVGAIFRLTIWHRSGLPEKLAVDIVRASATGDRTLITQTATEALQFALVSAMSSLDGTTGGTRYVQGTFDELLKLSRRELTEIYRAAHRHVEASQISLGIQFVEKVLSIASLEVAILSPSQLNG